MPIWRKSVFRARKPAPPARPLNRPEPPCNRPLTSAGKFPITRQETRVTLEARDQARAALNQAIANRSQVPQARQDVLAAQAAVQAAQAQLEQANVNLASARIFSPVNGVVSQKVADIGQTVSPSQTLLNLVALDEVYFEAQVSENELRQLREGQNAQVNVPSVSDEPLLATVTDIIPAADTRSRQFRVRILFRVRHANYQLAPLRAAKSPRRLSPMP